MNPEEEPKIVSANREGAEGSKGPWKYKRSGTMEHSSGLRVSPQEGISFEGETFKLTVDDVAFEGGDLGIGMCGTVKQGRIKKTNMAVAIKTMRVADGGDDDMLLNEVKALKNAKGCPFLVQWVAGFVSMSTRAVMLVLELMDGGSLRSVMDKIGEDSLVLAREHACIAWQAMKGLEFLHNMKVIHRDIKPANMLLNMTGEVKLTDFGISCTLDGAGRASNRTATRIYMAPEKYTEDSCSLPSDIWSMGLVSHELATGRHPFQKSLTDFELMNLLADEKEPRLPSEEHGAALQDFVARCLTRDVAMRADVGELLRHEFLAPVEESPKEFKRDLSLFLESLQSSRRRLGSTLSTSSVHGAGKSALVSGQKKERRSVRMADSAETIEVTDMSKALSMVPSFTPDEWVNVDSVTILSEEFARARSEASMEHRGSSARPNIEKAISKDSSDNNRSLDGRCLCVRGILTKLKLC